MRILILVVAVALSGCAVGPRRTANLYKPGVTLAQAKVDLAQCRYEAHKAVAPAMADAWKGSTVKTVEVQQEASAQYTALTTECMEARGYTNNHKAGAQWKDTAHPHKGTTMFTQASGKQDENDYRACMNEADSKFDNATHYPGWIKTMSACMESRGYKAVKVAQ